MCTKRRERPGLSYNSKMPYQKVPDLLLPALPKEITGFPTKKAPQYISELSIDNRTIQQISKHLHHGRHTSPSDSKAKQPKHSAPHTVKHGILVGWGPGGEAIEAIHDLHRQLVTSGRCQDHVSSCYAGLETDEWRMCFSSEGKDYVTSQDCVQRDCREAGRVRSDGRRLAVGKEQISWEVANWNG